LGTTTDVRYSPVSGRADAVSLKVPGLGWKGNGRKGNGKKGNGRMGNQNEVGKKGNGKLGNLPAVA